MAFSNILLIALITGLNKVTLAQVTIETPSGRVTGAISPYSNEVTRFLAIPYANTPDRFEKAEIASPWSEVHNGTEFGKGCMQSPFPGLSPREDMSEDCLTLDIYSPANLTTESQPSALKSVMVWIHGGGFNYGSSKLFEGSTLAAAGDVVVVVIQYRLGVFGFLYSQERTTTNLALWDQRLALQWVQANIQAFGGNKQQVTVFGESAGSISISCHMLSPKVNNSLFQRAILQSGSVLNGDKYWGTKYQDVDNIAEAAKKCENTDSLECLRSLTSDELVQAATNSRVGFWPTSGDSYLPTDSLRLLHNYHKDGLTSVASDIGNLGSYDMLIGHNGDEGLLMLGFIFSNMNWTDGITHNTYYTTAKEYVIQPFTSDQFAVEQLADSIVSTYNQTFPGIDNRTQEERNLKYAMEFVGDYVLAVPPILQAMIHSDSTATTASKSSNYYYVFDHKPEKPSALDQGPSWLKTSANHADELQFLFSGGPQFSGNLSDTEQALRSSMVQYWTNFVKTGHPGTEKNIVRGGAVWREFTSDDRDYMRLTTYTDVAEVKPRGQFPDFWLDIFTTPNKYCIS